MSTLPTLRPSPTPRLLKKVGPEHFVPPRNEYGIIAIHVFPDSPTFTLKEFNALKRVLEQVQPLLEEERRKPITEADYLARQLMC